MMQLTTFRLGDSVFGINALRVQEILTYQPITPVPLAPKHIKGLINLRGQIVTAIDLRQFLGFAPLPNAAGINLIVQSDEGAISWLVDDIGNVVDIAADQLLPPPGTVRGVAAQYIQGVCQLESDLLIVLNAEQVINEGK